VQEDETGKDLPKLDSLEKVLTALDVGHLKLFSTLDLVDRRAADLFPQRSGPRDLPSGILPEEMTAAFHRALTVLLELHQQVLGDEGRRGAEER
jgi:hypothetical protein